MALAQSIDYKLKQWPGFEVFLHDGRIDMSINLIELEMRTWKLRVSASKFVGSLAGLEIACIMRTLIGTCMLNGVNPLKYLSDVLGRISRLPQDQIQELLDNQKYVQLHELLPWNWKPETDGANDRCTNRPVANCAIHNLETT